MVRIPKTIFQKMVDHALREAPRECCGILAGKGRTVRRMYEMSNADGSRTTYLMAPEEQLEVFREMEKEHLDMVAIYHSHPHTIPFPSQRDVRLAFFPDVAYVIISLKDGGTTVKGFRIGKEAIYIEPIRVIERFS
ncbi:MAG: M67 family metallopeptidase [Syntrophobacterales bacterium]|nr:MAG: M67 family metallopeptidase [Syntrophobacterales bacterium]